MPFISLFPYAVNEHIHRVLRFEYEIIVGEENKRSPHKDKPVNIRIEERVESVVRIGPAENAVENENVRNPQREVKPHRFDGKRNPFIDIKL